ncbi:MAG: sulfate transporter CysZ [Pseudomonadales bacterium]|nr:sulfate transporter CysZ [Pseudomonadales bacterium]
MSIAEFSLGASYLQKGWQLAKQKELRAYLIIPVLFNVVFFSVMIYYTIQMMSGMIGGIGEGYALPAYLEWARSSIDFLLSAVEAFLWLVVGLVLVFVVGTTFTMITHLFIAPFNGLLAEKCEATQRELRYPEHSIWQIIGRSIARELQKLKYWISRAIPVLVIALILGFIPLVQLASPVIWYTFGAWMMAIQYIDIAADNNGLTFQQTLAVLRQNRSLIYGFGAIVMVLTVIPLVNLVIIPVAVVGATLLWVEKLEAGNLEVEKLEVEKLEAPAQ